MTNSPLDAPSLTAQDHAAGLAEYAAAGSLRAQNLGNRGPLRLTDVGDLHPDILAAYWRHGFYVFEGLVHSEEIAELREGVDNLLQRAPTGQGAVLDAQGRPAFGQEMTRSPYVFIKPLSDPFGGTRALGGRHPTKMLQPEPEQSSPAETVHILSAMCETMDAGLRLYGHPHLLAIAAGINGEDFVPYNDATFVKQAGLGGSVSWHQDGVTHWDADHWDEGIHGFNFQVQLFECTAQNSLWVVPGTHKLGRIDIKARVAANHGSEQLPDAVPLECQPGDVTVVNRQMLHGSFANTSAQTRISLTFGFHRRSSVLGASGALGQSATEVYDEERIYWRSALLPVAADARAQYYPDEERYVYQPFAGNEAEFRYDARNRDRVVHDYYLRDLSI